VIAAPDAAPAATVQLDFSAAFNADVVENIGDLVEGQFDSTGARMLTQAVAEANVPGDDDKGIPNDGTFSANSDHPQVILAATDSNDGNNAWKASGLVTETFAVSPIGQYAEVHFFASAGGVGPSSPAKFKVTLNYTDTTSTTSSEFSVPDWFGDISAPGYYLIDGMDRFQNPGYEDADTCAIFGFPLSVDANKTLESIDIEITANPGTFVFFGGIATTETTLSSSANLSISKSAEVKFLTEATFTVVAQNLGPDAADGAVVSDTLAATNFISVTWTCSASGGAACGAVSGTGDISDTLSAFPVNGVVTYTVQCTLVNWSVYENVAEISVPSGVSDPVTSNNRAVYKRYQLILPVIYRNWTP